jgi:phage-related protein
MSLGFVYKDVEYATPDKTLTNNIQPKVLIAKFGDGYEQRVPDGINNIKETYSIQFRNREKIFINEVANFLKGTNSVSKFDFILPNPLTSSPLNTVTVSVVCDSFNINYEHDEFYSLSAEFRRVYES